MPMGNGKLFLPVKAGIRTKIGKAEGNYVHVILYPDDLPVEIPGEIQLCLLDEPNAYTTFMAYTEGEKKAFIDWIYSAKKEETKIERIAKTISKIQKGHRLTAKTRSNDG
jgi:uncharacterized protein YdeI (YjbR/CyaY-like superfamily)